MNLKIKLLAVFAAALAAGGWWAWYNVPSRRVARVFDKAAAIAAKDAGEGLFVTAAKMSAAGGLVADELEVTAKELDARGPMTRDEFVKTAFYVRSRFRALRLRFDALEITVTNGGGTADAACDATLTGDGQPGEGRAEDVRAVTARLVKDADGDWRFQSITATPIIEK